MSLSHPAIRSESLRFWAIVAACAGALIAGCSGASDEGDNGTGGQGAQMGGGGGVSGNGTGNGGAKSSATGGKVAATGGKKNTGGAAVTGGAAATCTPAMRGQQGCSCLDPLLVDAGDPLCAAGLTCESVEKKCCDKSGDCSIKSSSGTGGKTGVSTSTLAGGPTGAGGTLSDAGTVHDSGTEPDEDASVGGGTSAGGKTSSGGTTAASTGTAHVGGVTGVGGVTAMGGVGGVGGIGGTGGTGTVACVMGMEQCSCYPGDSCFGPPDIPIQLTCYSHLCVDATSKFYSGDAGAGLDTGCEGTEGCNCYPTHACMGGLTCLSNMCVVVPLDAG